MMNSLTIDVTSTSTYSSLVRVSPFDFGNLQSKVTLLLGKISAKSKFSQLKPIQNGTCEQIFHSRPLPSLMLSTPVIALYARPVTCREDHVFRKAALRSSRVISMGKFVAK
jgi:hypothetical protein